MNFNKIRGTMTWLNTMLIVMMFIMYPGYSLEASQDEQSFQRLIDQASELYYSLPDSSFALCCVAEEKANYLKKKELIGHAKLCKIRYLLLKSKLDEAGQELNQATDLFLEVNSFPGLAKTYSYFYILSGRIGKEKESLKYLERSNAIYKDLKDTAGVVKTLTNLSVQYIQMNQYAKARQTLEELTLYKDATEISEDYYINQNWGYYYKSVENYPKALEYYNVALAIADKKRMIDSKATICKMIGTVFQLQAEYEQAENMLLESLKISEEAGLLMEIIEAQEELFLLYEKTGHVDKALDIFKKKEAIKDTLYNIEKVNRVNEYEKKLAVAEKEKIITEQHLEIEMEQAKSKVTTARNELLATALGLVIVIGLVGIGGYIKNSRLKNQVIAQKCEVERKSQHLEQAYNDITDSITYAKRIQDALLKGEKHESLHLPEHFIYFKPKDIVSGDFYWSLEKSDVRSNEKEVYLYLAAADCTGHGVPGAFLTMLGTSFLNEINAHDELLTPAQILDELRKRMISELSQTGMEGESKDGMDISLFRLNLKTYELQWSGANNPLYLISDSNPKVINIGEERTKLSEKGKTIVAVLPNKQAVGYDYHMKPFTNHTIQLQKKDYLCIFTDGFADQFGGPRGKKFKYKPFKELLLSIQDNTMENQRQIIEETFENWKGDLEQVDDVCVIGVRI